MMVEIIIATSIITFFVLVALNVAQKALVISRQSIHLAQASFLLEEGEEAVKILRDNNWTNISNLNSDATYYPTFSGGTWTLSGTPNQVGIFTRTVIVSTVNRDAGTADISLNGSDDPGTKLVTVSVSWLEGGVITSRSLKFYIFNIFQ